MAGLLISCLVTYGCFSYFLSLAWFIAGAINLNGRFRMPICSMVTIAVVATGLHLLIPPAIEAHHYKKYEYEKFAEIERQKKSGIKNIVLYRTWPAPPKDALGMICSMELGPDPQRYPNSSARNYYGVEAISLKAEIKPIGFPKAETKGMNLGFELEKTR